NRYEQGEDYYKRMIATDIDSLGPHHPSVANDLNGLAQFYIRRGNYSEAEPLITRAFSIYQKTYGMNNVLTISTCAAYALVEFHLGKID
ncbi:tetratricopeptide repeat protein, partial [Acinetobacter baumannii]